MCDVTMLMKDTLAERQLNQAEVALSGPDVLMAQRYLQIALSGPSPFGDIQDRIRDMLKDHSERLLPDWNLAQETLGLIDTLGINNGETRTWQMNLWLQQAELHFQNPEMLDRAITIFVYLKTNKLWQDDQEYINGEVVRIIQTTLLNWFDNGQQQIAHNAIQQLKKAWPQPDNFFNWLDVVSASFKQPEGLHKPKETQRPKPPQTTAEVPNSRYRLITQSLAMIFVAYAVLYLLVLVL
ncbi:MAG: hypothetical protein AAF629_11360 [Chloroflexota bacterium]